MMLLWVFVVLSCEKQVHEKNVELLESHENLGVSHETRTVLWVWETSEVPWELCGVVWETYGWVDVALLGHNLELAV